MTVNQLSSVPKPRLRSCSVGEVRYSVRRERGILSICRAVRSSPRRISTVFIDRDGVLNRRVMGGYVTRWSEFEIMPGVSTFLRQLRSLNCQLVIVSNQAAVAKGLLSWQELANMTLMSFEAFQVPGGIDGAFFCLHQSSDGCSCRKPRTGLLEEAARRLDISFEHSFFIGDSRTDIFAGSAMGCKTVYLSKDADATVHPTVVASTPREAALWIGRELKT